jgi:serine/threonine protein kinase
LMTLKTMIIELNLINYYNKMSSDHRFRKLRLLGKGGFGKVYQAIDMRSGEIVALKEMFGTYISWEQCCNMTEVKALQVLNHPNIVTLKEVVLQD